MGLRICGFGFAASGLRLRVWGLGLRVSGGLGCAVDGLGVGAVGMPGFKVSGLWFRAWGPGMCGFGFRHLGV